MQDERLLLRLGPSGYVAKPVKVFDKPAPLKALLKPASWKILNLLAKNPMYPVEIAKSLNLYPQTAYYYIRHLLKAGLIKVDRTKMIKGAVARYYTPTYPAFSIEMPSEEQVLPLSSQVNINPKLETFLGGFVKNGVFDGLIVVGSPEPHGPFKATARDGHYAVQVGFFLGRFCKLPSDFIVKLDVDLRTERREGENLILIGGPGTNLVTEGVNRFLPTRFVEENYWKGLIKATGSLYSSERDGLIAKIRNPFQEDKSIIILAGNRYIGTKSCVIALTLFDQQVLRSYDGQDTWSVVVRGYDLDGDGKVDSVEVLD
ncbi:MAG: winged helix-turn-helix transcriptional regulator [Thaumarchaeota archaeon]|nr:winged helix-turn-helix transcriptional regulator [Nitrososphaerota archaeon]